MRRLLLWSALGILVSSAVGLTALRVLLPRLDTHPQQVAQWVSQAVGYRVEFTQLRAGLRGITPELTLQQVGLTGSDGSVTRVEALRLRFAWWASLLARQPRLADIEIVGLHLGIVRDADARWRIGGMQLGHGGANAGFSAWLLAQPQVRLSAAVIDIRDDQQAARAISLQDAEVQMRRHGGHHWLDLRVGVAGAASGALHLQAQIDGLGQDLGASEGRVYAIARDMQGVDVPLWRSLFSGRLDAEVWLRWKQGNIERVHGRIDGLGELHQAQAKTAIPFDALHLEGVWQRQPQGWVAGIDSLRLGLGERAWRLDHGYVERSGDRWTLAAGLLDVPQLGPLADLLPPSQAEDGSSGAMLAQADPTVRARDLKAVIDRTATLGQRLRLAAQVDELAWRPMPRLPGLAGVAGDLRLTDAAASFKLQGAPHLTLDAPSAYAAPVQMDRARGELAVQWSSEGRQAQLKDFAVLVGSIPVSVRGRLSLPAQDGEPELFMQASIPQAPAAEFFALLPDRALSPKFIDWGRDAIQGGTLRKVQALLRGDPRRFPYRDARGQFLGTAEFTDIKLDYRPGAGWPVVSEGDGRFALRGPEFELTLDDGRLLDSRATELQVRIPDVALRSKRLLLDGIASGSAQDVIHFVQQSPLAARFGKAVSLLGFDGPAQTSVSLDLVFSGPVRSTKISGVTRLTDNRLRIGSTGLTLDALRGEVGFSATGLRAQGVQAQLFGGPVAFDLETAPANAVRIEPRGQADALLLQRYLRLPRPFLFRGKLPWQGRVDIAGDGRLGLDLNLDVAAAVGDLPTPLDALKLGPLQVRADCECGGSTPRTWDVVLAAQPLVAHLDIGPREDSAMALRRGDLAIAVESRLPAAGFRMHGRIERLPLSPWLSWLGEHFRSDGGGSWPVPQVDVYVDQLDYLGQSFDQLRLQVARSEGWDIALDAADVAGQVRVRGGGAEQQVELALDRLHLKRDEENDGRTAAGVDPAKVPVLRGRIGELHYGGETFGALELSSRRLADGLAFDNLRLEGDFGGISGTGAWRGHQKNSTSSLDASADFKDFGAFLGHFGVKNLVREGRGKLRAEVSWPGSPGAFAFAALDGKVSGALRKGTLPDVEPGVGRLFGILSLDSVARRLSLDFRDVFGRGFAIDRMDGELLLAAGQAQLKNLRVRGPAAHLTLNGRTNLTDRSLDVEVLSAPQVTSSLPLAGAIAAPGVGAAIYLGQKIFEGAIDKVTEQRYHVTGTWADPKVEKR
ncbi:YhdP family protein [Immundisolibacter sp.]|uniref:YhdP family protein n=1 Tax=Immundisolibacter sp. TaxID=1934948 RepID=UPI0035669721